MYRHSWVLFLVPLDDAFHSSIIDIKQHVFSTAACLFRRFVDKVIELDQKSLEA